MLALALAAVLLESSPLPVVALDAGHGGEQSGAVGVCGIREKDVALAIIHELAQLLRASGRAEPFLTRSGDETVKLEERPERAKAAGAILFVSVHANAAPNETSAGVETYFLSLRAWDKRVEQLALVENEGVIERESSDTLGRILDSLRLRAAHAESQRLAALVQTSIIHRLGERDRGVFQAPFIVLRRAEMAAILVEVGFLSNPAECVQLGSPSHQRSLAQALAAAILAHLWTSGEAAIAAGG